MGKFENLSKAELDAYVASSEQREDESSTEWAARAKREEHTAAALSESRAAPSEL